MFEGRQNMVLYAVATGLLYGGVWIGTDLTMWFAVLLFLLWDIAYARDDDAFAGRDVGNLLNQVNTARLHMSYFLPFYGVLLGILFTLDSEKQQAFFGLLAGAEIGMGLLLAPLVIASLGILFVPIRLVRRPQEDSWVEAQGSEELPASDALRALLGAAAFFQQASIFMFLHVILRLVAAVDLPGVILTG